MPKHRSPLDWMDVSNQEFVAWAAPYLSARKLIDPAYTNPAQALHTFQTHFISQHTSDAPLDAHHEKLARNLKQAWVKHLKRKAARGKQKPYSFEMDVRVHDKLKSIAKSLGRPIYQTLEALILDAGKVQSEIRQQGKERVERLKNKQPSQSLLIEKQANEIQALAALAAGWEREAAQLSASRATLLMFGTGGKPLSRDQQNAVFKAQQSDLINSRRKIEASLGLLKLSLPKQARAIPSALYPMGEGGETS